MSSDMAVTVEILPPKQSRKHLAFQITLEAESQWRGDTVFEWKRAVATENTRASMWLMSFYRRTVAQAFIVTAAKLAALEEDKTSRSGSGRALEQTSGTLARLEAPLAAQRQC